MMTPQSTVSKNYPKWRMWIFAPKKIYFAHWTWQNKESDDTFFGIFAWFPSLEPPQEFFLPPLGIYQKWRILRSKCSKTEKKRKNVRMLVEADLFTYTCAENKCRCRKILISPAQEILKQHHLSFTSYVKRCQGTFLDRSSQTADVKLKVWPALFSRHLGRRLDQIKWLLSRRAFGCMIR